MTTFYFHFVSVLDRFGSEFIDEHSARLHAEMMAQSLASLPGSGFAGGHIIVENEDAERVCDVQVSGRLTEEVLMRTHARPMN